MASIRENSKVDSLTTMRPNDRYHILINEILHRLPAKSLCRFKCVCKRLNTLISSPEFIKFHLNLALDVNHVFVFAYDFNEGRTKRSLYTFNLDDSSKISCKKIHIPLERYTNFDHQFFFAGSCNDLHCTVRMSSIYLDIIIFNPSTGIYKRVEVTDLAFHGTSSILISEDRHFTNFGFGFGFDNVNDDYKVVKVTSNHFHDLRVVDSKVMVYSLKTNSWRRAQNFPRSLNWYADSLIEAAVVDNHLLHWLIYSPLGQLEIACFDISNETWREDIACPNSLVTGSCSSPQLGVLDGCLYLFFKILSTSKFDVWVMKEYGVKESWVKLFGFDYRVLVNNIYHRTRRLRLLGYNNKSKYEILIWDGTQSCVTLFDIKNNNVKRVMIDGIPTSTTAANAMRYVIPSSTIGYVCNGTLVNILGGRPLRVNKGFRLTTFKEVFRLASRKCTKGRTNNALAKQKQQRDFNLQGRQQGKRLMNNKWTR